MSRGESGGPTSAVTRTGAVHDAAIAVLAVGSGVGVHFFPGGAPLVASASVLAAAMVSRHRYNREIQVLNEDIREVRRQVDALSRQINADRRSGMAHVPWMANISHEIRSPLTAVVALGEMLDASSLSDEQRVLVRDIRDAGTMVLGVVNDTLDLAKVESGRLRLNREPFSPRELCERVGRLARSLMATKPGLEMVITSDGFNRTVLGDELRIQQVLLNLTSNAIKYSTAGLIQINYRVEATAATGEGTTLRFSVRDCGPGLSAEQRETIFQPYARLDEGGHEPHAGTGLGLYLCEQFVRVMGGSIGVDSEPGQGAEFWFTIPLMLATEDRSAAGSGVTAAAVKAARSARLQGRVIAVVDDARISREAARRLIEADAGMCLMFPDGESLLNHLRQGHSRIDLILMDLEMPGMDGFDVCRELYRLQDLPAIPVVAVSGTSPDALGPNWAGSGMRAHVLKPFHAETLLGTIIQQLD